MDLLETYARALDARGYQADPGQRRAIETLDRVRARLLERRRPGLLDRLRGRAAAPARGAYLWGGVGRGKTFAMDLFFESLPFDDKLRYHFHRLMYRVHRRLAELGNARDPLATVAGELSNQARVICFDEFAVSDIGDAMILARLLDGLFERGVALVATSNLPPETLYRDGLQRQKFLPAIELIERHTEVVHVDGDTDYRLRALERAGVFHTPLGPAADTALARHFAEIAGEAGNPDERIEILGRDIALVRRADGVAWFEFAELCGGPRSQNDYIELARCFHTVIVANCPRLDRYRENEARRFIALVDEFYERRVKLILSAATTPQGLYAGRQLRHEFRRTRSRLEEMQSHEYLAAAHVP